ncbi:MAG: hypothetical protein J5938_05445 [Clostridia bacterium]|nr:hypothetical protein [Clostridia bacterium]
MSDFLKFVDDLTGRFPLHMEIYYSKTVDWCIKIWKKGCAEEYPYAEHEGEDVILVKVQDCDMELAFARAQVELKEWMIQFNEGY